MSLLHLELLKVLLISRTYFAAADVNDLVAELLANPQFEDVQYQHFRVNRRFLEAAYSY